MIPLERQITDQNWFTFTILLCIITLAVLKVYKPKLLLGFTILFFSQGLIHKKAEENASIFTPFNLGLTLFSTLIFSLALFSFGITETNNFLGFTKILGLVFLYIIARNTLDFIIEKTTISNEETFFFRLTKVSYLFTTAICFFPFLIIYQYGLKNKLLLILSLGFFMLMRIILVTLNNKNLILKNLFYFILYICTLEIAPLLTFYKLIVV